MREQVVHAPDESGEIAPVRDIVHNNKRQHYGIAGSRPAHLKILKQHDKETSARAALEITKKIDHEARRREFSERVKALYNKNHLLEEYIKEIVCASDEQQFHQYESRVAQYKEKGGLGKFFNKNPEIQTVPMEHGYIISKIIGIYVDAFGDAKTPTRVLYPAAGGDTANLLAYVDRLKGKNIQFIFVDPGISSTGTPRSKIIPKYKLDQNFSVENHAQKFEDYLKTDPKSIDIFLYDSTAITPNPMNAFGGAGYLSFEGDIDTEKLEKLFQTDSLIIGNDEQYNNSRVFGISEPVRSILNEGFEKIEGAMYPPISIRKEGEGAVQEKIMKAA